MPKGVEPLSEYITNVDLFIGKLSYASKYYLLTSFKQFSSIECCLSENVEAHTRLFLNRMCSKYVLIGPIVFHVFSTFPNL